MGIEFLNAQTSYEKFIMIFSMVLGVLMVSGFFLGIPILIEKSFKKKINKIIRYYIYHTAKIVPES